jgi:ribose/xylose/arabinose/galactoside ABC-type transport system permease subunit
MMSTKNFKHFLATSPSSPGYVLLSISILINIGIQGGGFFSPWNFSSILNTATPLILVSIAQMTVILVGGVDLSLGANMAFVNAVAIVMANNFGLPLWQSWLIALAAGTMIGFLNGAIVAFIRLPPFLSTFATMSVVLGLALIVLPTPGGSVPKEIYSKYGGFTLGLPTPLFILAAVVFLWSLIFRTPLGKHIRAVGGNPRNAYISGINVEATRLAAFTLGGFFSGLAGICLTAYMGAGDPLIGGPYTLKSIATVILGGTMFDSGWGAVGGTVSGSLFFVLVSNIVFFAFNKMQMLIPDFSVSTFYQDLLANSIIIFGLVSSVFFKKTKHGGEPQTPPPGEAS